jgi:anti-anti-sigma regulatory factor
MTDLLIDVERLPELGAFAVCARGPLTAWNRHELRRTVFKCLAEVPAAIIVDLHGVYLVDRIAAAAFVAMRRMAANTGPGVSILLSGVDDVLLAQRVRALDRTQPIFQDLFDAVTAVREGPVGARWLWRRLSSGLQAPIEAGVLIAETCRTWGLSHLVFPARSTLFDLSLVARRCPEGQMRLAALYENNRLVLSIRTPAALDRTPTCVRHRPPRGYRHRATASGHILWTTLSTDPPEV